MLIEAVNGETKIHVDVTGPADGPLVVLVSGIGQQIGDVEFADEHAQCFANAGFRVARMDNRDAGLSSSFDHVGRPELDPILNALFAMMTNLSWTSRASPKCSRWRIVAPAQSTLRRRSACGGRIGERRFRWTRRG